MMTLKPFELGDHYLAGWDQRVALSVEWVVIVWHGDRDAR